MTPFILLQTVWKVSGLLTVRVMHLGFEFEIYSAVRYIVVLRYYTCADFSLSGYIVT